MEDLSTRLLTLEAELAYAQTIRRKNPLIYLRLPLPTDQQIIQGDHITITVRGKGNYKVVVLDVMPHKEENVIYIKAERINHE